MEKLDEIEKNLVIIIRNTIWIEMHHVVTYPTHLVKLSDENYSVYAKSCLCPIHGIFK